MSRRRTSLTLGAAGATAAIGALTAAHRNAARIAQAVETSLPLAPDGWIVGAAPMQLRVSSTHAALVLHGFADTPQSVRGLAGMLAGAGWTVDVPALPGHARTLAEFGAARADDWIGFVMDRVAQLRRHYGVVAIVGQSVGGALATIAAAEHDDLAALVLLAPYYFVPPRIRRLAPLLRVGGWLWPFHVSRRSGPSILDPVARGAARGFGLVSGRLLAELEAVTRAARSALPEVVAPTLVIASRQDVRVPVEATEAAWDSLGAPVRELVWLEDSGHVIAVDRERDAVWRRTLAWLDACGGTPGTRAGAPPFASA